MNSPVDPAIQHDRQRGRFHVSVEGHQAHLEYREDDGRMVITHTEVPPPIGGKGIAAALVVAALEYARASSMKVEPACEYAATFMHRHGEYADLLE